MITGCNNCPSANFRFNNGNGAVTCDELKSRIVSYGNKIPEMFPYDCPKNPHKTDEEVRTSECL